MPYLDKEEKFYDYRTSEIDGENIFDLNKASNSDAQQLLDNRDSKYWRDEKNTYSEIVEMSPMEYFTRCAEDCFDEPVDKLIKSRRRDTYTLNHLKEVLLKYKRRFPLTYIWYATFNHPEQEGLHRMMVAGDLFGWDKKFPVQIIRWVDEKRAQETKIWKHKREIERYLEIAINHALRYKYYNLEEVKDQLRSEFESEVRYLDEFEDRDFELDLIKKDDYNLIAIVDNTYTSEFPIDSIDFIDRNDSDDDLEDVDLDDLSDWMKDLLADVDIKKHNLNEVYGHTDEYLRSEDLYNNLKEIFGEDFSTKPISKEICNYIAKICKDCKVLDTSVHFWKEENYSLTSLLDENTRDAVIEYDGKIYDYTSNQFIDQGIPSVKNKPMILDYDPNSSQIFGLRLFRNGIYLISAY